MASYKVVEIDMSLEKNILIGMITSTDFLKRLAPVLDLRLFTTKASMKAAQWVMEYHGRYAKAPERDIEAIYRDKMRYMDGADAEWMSMFLGELSQQYERTGLNEAYLFDRAVEYFRKQRMTNDSKAVLKLLEDGKVSEAEQLWLKSMRMPGAVEDAGVDPFNMAQVRKLKEGRSRFGMSLGISPLDSLAGAQLSEWLIMVMGPMKRGKTQFLTHCAVHAKLLGLNVVMFSLESGYEDITDRMLMSAASLTYNERDMILFPKFSPDGKVVYEKIDRPSVRDLDAVGTAVRKFNRLAVGSVRLKSFPAYTAGLDEMRYFLDYVEAFEGLIPHVIVIDYLGAMRPPKGATGRDAYDVNSKGMKGLSQERKCVVFSAHQGSRATLEKMTMRPTDIPEDVRILGNVDILYGLNQTEEEKEQNVMRMNVLMHRFRKFNRLKQVKILQQPEAGQFCLDAVACDAPLPKVARVKRPKEEEREEEE